MSKINNIDLLFEDFLDNVSAEDLSRKKASDKLNAQEKRLTAWELLDKYDYLFIIRTDIIRVNDIKEKLVKMNDYLDEVLTMSRCVADFELGLMYIQENPEKLDKSYRKFGILDEGTNVVCIEDAKTAELLVGSVLTKSNRMYVTFGANMTPNIKGIIRLLPSFNLRRSETDHSFIMNEISIIKSDSNPLIENNEKELRYIDASHCTDILRDVYNSDSGDHFFQVISYKGVIRALMFLMPNSKEKIMDVMSAFRPKCHEYYIAQFMKDVQQRYLVNQHPHLTIKSDRKIALKKSVVDLLLNSDITNIMSDSHIVYTNMSQFICYINVLTAADIGFEEINKIHSAAGGEVVKKIIDKELTPQAIQFRAISPNDKLTPDIVVLVISLGYTDFQNNEYLCALVISGTSGGMMGNFYQYAQQLKKVLNPDLDEYYLTNIIDKALK